MGQESSTGLGKIQIQNMLESDKYNQILGMGRSGTVFIQGIQKNSKK